MWGTSKERTNLWIKFTEIYIEYAVIDMFMSPQNL